MDIKNSKLKEVIVFIDGNNLFHRSRSFYHTHLVDIEKLSKTLCCPNRHLKQIRYYYSPFVVEVGEKAARLQQAYIESISKISNIELIEGKYIRKPIVLSRKTLDKIKEFVNPGELITYIEKRTDVNIAVDIVTMYPEYDCAILISTDSDFAPIATYIQTMPKKKIQVAAFLDDNHSCYDLKNHFKSFINMHHYLPGVIKHEADKAKEPC